MTRGVQFFLILGVGLLILDGALFLLAMDRSPKADVTGPRVVSSGTAAIGGPFMLMAMDGKTVSDLTYRGKWMLIYFGYTSCPDACPTALTNMSIAIEKLEKEGIENDKLVPLFITVDPDRDTRSVVAEYLRSFDPWIVGLTGSQEQTDAAVKRYRVDVERHKNEGGNYPVDHSSYFYLMDPGGKFVDAIEAATPPDQIAKRLAPLIAAKRN